MLNNKGFPPHVHSSVPFWYAAGAFIFIPLILLSTFFFVQRIIHFKSHRFVSRRYAYGFMAFGVFLFSFVAHAAIIGFQIATQGELSGERGMLIINLGLLIGSEMMMRVSAMRASPSR